MTDDIAALIEETEHLLAILEQKATEEMGGYDYVRPKIKKAKDALSCLTTTPLPEALIAETERALREAPQDILRRNLAALRALAQENERLKAALDEIAGNATRFARELWEWKEHADKSDERIRELEAERDAIKAKTIEECAKVVEPLAAIYGDGTRTIIYSIMGAIHALAQTDETKSNVAAIANSHI